VSNNPYPFFKYHQNDKVVKRERLSIEGKKTGMDRRHRTHILRGGPS
jgi:hypothetical protein